MTQPSEGDSNGPARGPSFSVVAPALGVCVFLVVLAMARCDDAGPSVTAPPHGTSAPPGDTR